MPTQLNPALIERRSPSRAISRTPTIPSEPYQATSTAWALARRLAVEHRFGIASALVESAFHRRDSHPMPNLRSRPHPGARRVSVRGAQDRESMAARWQAARDDQKRT